jgi:hypothetical protein
MTGGCSLVRYWSTGTAPRPYFRVNERGIEQLRAAFKLDREASDAIPVARNGKTLLELQRNASRWSTIWMVGSGA